MKRIKLPNITKPAFVTSLQVRIYDINYGNHLGNDALVSLLHESRVRFLKHHGFSELNIDGMGILITNLFVNYKAESFYDDNIDIYIGIGETSRTSIDLHYELRLQQTQKEIAQAVTTIAFYDYSKLKVASIPKVFQEALSSYEVVSWL